MKIVLCNITFTRADTRALVWLQDTCSIKSCHCWCIRTDRQSLFFFVKLHVYRIYVNSMLCFMSLLTPLEEYKIKSIFPSTGRNPKCSVSHLRRLVFFMLIWIFFSGVQFFFLHVILWFKVNYIGKKYQLLEIAVYITRCLDISV